VRVEVDTDACVGTGQCEMICPEVFTVGVVVGLLTEHPDRAVHDAVREAAESCPTQAIIVVEES
jgi:ferredoxin